MPYISYEELSSSERLQLLTEQLEERRKMAAENYGNVARFEDGMGGMAPTEPESLLSQRLKQLDKLQEEGDALLGVLETKLAIVLRPVPENVKEAGEVQTPEPPTSGLVRVLNSQIFRLHQRNRRLERLLNRLEV
jgi:hypothetical protein